ncbi:hypothetical protein B0J13DRAFT_168384 [Dactylonectria estremocensis]|uniref:Uncharacterized protein n=1 Tax=Dactylonectria estremocensis TaxID=1079267 RepID=A0A9P9JGQ2_9HYPO|nr:hypothetical protein B0J13DRAFT_168384 [Dactylonectria estremocensis]
MAGEQTGAHNLHLHHSPPVGYSYFHLLYHPGVRPVISLAFYGVLTVHSIPKQQKPTTSFLIDISTRQPTATATAHRAPHLAPTPPPLSLLLLHKLLHKLLLINSSSPFPPPRHHPTGARTIAFSLPRCWRRRLPGPVYAVPRTNRAGRFKSLQVTQARCSPSVDFTHTSAGHPSTLSTDPPRNAAVIRHPWPSSFLDPRSRASLSLLPTRNALVDDPRRLTLLLQCSRLRCSRHQCFVASHLGATTPGKHRLCSSPSCAPTSA